MAGADISLTFNDCTDDLTDEGFEQDDYTSPTEPQFDDTSLTPLLRIQKYAQSGDVYDRHLVSKVVQDIFRTAPADLLARELKDVMTVLIKVADDGALKADLIDDIPNIAAQALENANRVRGLEDIVGDFLVPLVVRNLGCSDAGMDKKAQKALIELTKRRYVTQFQAEIKICPSILALTKMESQLDVISGAVTLMSKLSPHLGKDITERILLKRFTELCSSEMFYVRKLSTAHFGYYCLVISRETFEKTILPCYLALCQDEIWGVRKMCADVIVYISAVCPTQLRYDLLAPTFAKLLGDECRWVRLSAYQTLGAFIATFADPPLIKIDTNSSGDLILINNNGDEFNPGATFGFSTINSIYMKEDFGFNNVLKQNYDENNGGAQLDDWMVKLLEDCEEEQKKENSCGGGDSKKEKYISQHEDDLLLYSDLNYWYTRPPPLDLQLSVETLPSIGNQANVSLEDIVTDHLEEMYATINLNESKLPPGGAETPSSDIKGDNLELTNVSDSNSTVNSLKPVEEKKEPPQKIVPQDLLDSYIAMARSENNLENDMSFFCAYSLPAVLLTLGRDNWPLLKSTLDNLAGHVSYKVRRSIASSLHEIGTILGTELASKDLSPLFEGFLKDLDEVRIRILTNLSAFLQLIDEEQRIKFLPKLDEFLRVDYAFNWRFHETLAQQLTECVPLFQPADVVKYIRFSEALMTHNVAVVRDAALILVARIVKHIYKDRSLTSSYLSVIAERFAHSKKWKLRQTFACLCAEILARDAMEPEEFASLLLPHLLDLSWDPVANVRLVVARCIVNHIIKKEFFADPQNEKIDALQTVLRRLQADKDRDVRMLAELPL